MKNEQKTMYSLGNFKFTSKTNINSLTRDFESGIELQNRIANHSKAIVAKKWEETINFEGDTIPAQGVGFKALDLLYRIAKKQQAVTLTSGRGEYFGSFIISSISEGRSSFTSDGGFMHQSFSLELKRVYNG